MNACPVEIIERIFLYACEDDAQTGLSLSQVSKRCNELSSPFQWRTVSLSGFASLRSFASRLERYQSHSPHRPRPIHHLFISDRPSTHSSDRWNRLPDTPISTIEQLYLLEEKERHSWSLSQSSILAYAAPTLVSLTYLSFDPRNSAMRVSELVSVGGGYPALTELTIRVPPLQPLFASPPIDIATLNNPPTPRKTHSHLPSLRHVHLICDFREFTGARTRIKSLCPSVTHLRLSGIISPHLASILHSELSDRAAVSPALTLPSGQVITASLTNSESYFLPPSPPFRSLVVQPFSPSYCKDWSMDGGESVIDLLRLMSPSNRNKLNYQFLACPPSKRSYGYREAKADWLSRVRGGEGCWAPRQYSDSGALTPDKTPSQEVNPPRAPDAHGHDSRTFVRTMILKFLLLFLVKYCLLPSLLLALACLHLRTYYDFFPFVALRHV